MKETPSKNPFLNNILIAFLAMVVDKTNKMEFCLFTMPTKNSS